MKVMVVVVVVVRVLVLVMVVVVVVVKSAAMLVPHASHFRPSFHPFACHSSPLQGSSKDES